MKPKFFIILPGKILVCPIHERLDEKDDEEPEAWRSTWSGNVEAANKDMVGWGWTSEQNGFPIKGATVATPGKPTIRIEHKESLHGLINRVKKLWGKK